MAALTTAQGASREFSVPPGRRCRQPRTAVTFRPGALVMQRKGTDIAEIPLSASARTDLIALGAFVGTYVFTASSSADGDGGSLDPNGYPESITVEGGHVGWFDTGGSGNRITDADIDTICYAYDDNTLYRTSLGGTLSAVGYVAAIGTGIFAGKVKVRLDPAVYAVGPSGPWVSQPYTTDAIDSAAATSTTALKTATLITTDPQTILAAALVSGGKAACLAHPRNFTITGGGTTAHCPTSVTATGTDIDGAALTETKSLSSGSGVGVKAFATFTSFVFTGATVGDGSCAIGIGSKFGFSRTPKLITGIPHILDEYLDGVAVDPSTATVVDAVTSPPHGTWAPADVPDGSDLIAITYEHT